MKTYRAAVGKALLCFGISIGGVFAADIPGSAVMPPKDIESPVPAPSGTGRGQVKVGVWIKEDGTVEDAKALEGTEAWRAAAVEAAKRWKFEPVKWEGAPIVARTEITFADYGKDVRASTSPLPNFPGELHNEDEFGLAKPMLQRDRDIIFPLAARVGRKVSVVIRFVVMEDGSIAELTPLGADSEHAWRAAADYVLARVYEPGRLKERPVRVEYKQSVSYHSTDKPLPDLSGATTIVDPVFPYERLVARESGHAIVKLTLSEKGDVAKTELVEASHPDFGGALLAAAESWVFSPESAVEKNVREYRHEFSREDAPYACQRIADLVREGGKIASSGAGLDKKPEMLWAPPLGYPRSLITEGVAGTAKIEMVIDRAGLAQVPRIVEASRPEFGWTAATFVNGMRFRPLTRNGRATELRVVLPVTFAAPKAPAEPVAAVTKE